MWQGCRSLNFEYLKATVIAKVKYGFYFPLLQKHKTVNTHSKIKTTARKESLNPVHFSHYHSEK